jgi:hypothetical protein
MRLLNSATVKLEEFPDDHIPAYAILSHRWQDDELSFQDMQSGSATEKAGYAKLKSPLSNFTTPTGINYEPKPN